MKVLLSNNNKTVYIADGKNGLKLIDVTNNTNLKVIGSF